MKKIIYFLSVFLLVFISCDPEDIRIEDKDVLPKEESLDTVVFRVNPKYLIYNINTEPFREELKEEYYQFVHVEGYFVIISPVFTAPKYDKKKDGEYTITIDGFFEDVVITGDDATALIGTEVNFFFISYGGCRYRGDLVGLRHEPGFRGAVVVKKGVNIMNIDFTIIF